MNITIERKAIETTYTDTCTVSAFGKATEHGMTRNKPAVLYEGTPCALSQKTNRYTKQTDTVNHIIYDAKLFIAPELEIPAGCEVTVTRYKRVFKYVSAGEPFVYATHQEIMLLRKDKA